jgi:hypothetical protein
MAWPVEPVASPEHPRIRESKTNPPPKPGHADTLNPNAARLEEQDALRDEARQEQISVSELQARQTDEHGVKNQSEMINAGVAEGASADALTRVDSTVGGEAKSEPDDVERWEPKPPKVLMNEPDAVPLEVLSQIQQYATNE